jgi:hypothetical protein
MDSDTTHAINELSAHVGQLQEAVRKLSQAVLLLANAGDSLEATDARSLAAEAQRLAGA